MWRPPVPWGNKGVLFLPGQKLPLRIDLYPVGKDPGYQLVEVTEDPGYQLVEVTKGSGRSF